jgi:hypothetical protein
LYATHYNDDDDTLGIGLELKKLQFQYSNYEGLGAPISTEILTRCRRPFSDDLFPYYFYDRTTMDDYQNAVALERMGCCVTKMEYANSAAFGKKLLVSLSYSFNEFNYYMILCLTCVHLINEFFESNPGLDDVSPTSNLLKLADNNVILDSPQKPPKNSSEVALCPLLP